MSCFNIGASLEHTLLFSFSFASPFSLNPGLQEKERGVKVEESRSVLRSGPQSE